LKDVLNDYSKLMEQSIVLSPRLNDALVQIGNPLRKPHSSFQLFSEL